MVTGVGARRAAAFARLGVGLGAAVAAPACKPELDQTVSLVSQPEMLAVRSDPAEAAPRAAVRYQVLVVDNAGSADGGRLANSVDWAYCNAREPLAELGPVSQKCYQSSGDWFTPFGVGVQASGSLPVAACRQFGPEVPEPQAGQPPGRPVDPDATGGYYQPIRVRLPAPSGAVVDIGSTRLTCGLAGTPDQVAQFAAHYIANTNPEVASLSDGTSLLSGDQGGAANAVHLGQSLSLVATWTACPQPAGGCGDGFCDLGETAVSCPGDCANLVGCSGAETYVALDLESHNLVTRREAIQVAWFATGGHFENDRTGRDSNDALRSTGNTWTAPATQGLVHLWVVVRDERGGVGWTEYAFDVR